MPTDPDYRPCPFCDEPVRPQARKCRHCGETLDPALRAAEEAKRAAARSPRPYVRDDEGERAARSRHPQPFKLTSCLGGCGTLILVGFGLAVVIGMAVRWHQRNAVNEATRLWDAGQYDAAVERYKVGFDAAGDERPAILKRIVERDLARGDQAEAKKWAERGADAGLEPPYAEPAAVALHAQAKRDRDTRRAKEREEAERRAKEREEASRGISVTADQLRRDYQADPRAADTKYKGKALRVTGTVHEYIGDSARDRKTPFVVLALAPNAEPWVWCRFPLTADDKLRGLRAGQAVTVACRCEGAFVGEIRLTLCTLEP